LCYDNKNYKVVEEEGCFSKKIGRNKESIAEPSIETKVGVAS
jgi:hypothetical protein